MTQQHGLSWGALDFTNTVPPETDYRFDAMADGTHMGNPEAVIEIVRSLLTDGSLAVLEGWDNRTIPIRLMISAPQGIAGPALAEAESVLMLAIQAKVKEHLVYVPPAQDAATCVFDVVAATLDRDTSEGWDFDETKREQRFYLLTLTCLPFVHGPETVVVPAIPLPPDPGGTVTFDDLDTCDSTTNWAATYDLVGRPDYEFSTSLAVVSGAVRASITPVSGGSNASRYQGITLTRTGALSLATLPYLVVDVRPSHPAIYPTPTFTINGAAIDPTSVETLAGGYTRYYFATDDVTELTCSLASAPGIFDWSARWLEVDLVGRTDTIGDATTSTLRQQSRTVAIPGSAPTQAAIRLYDATPAPLGKDILVYTGPTVLPLRKWLDASGIVTADSSLVSGGWQAMDTASVFTIPASYFAEATYALMARVDVTVAGDVSWSARMVDSTGATTVGSSVVVSGTATLDVTTGYEVLSLAQIPLPVLAAEADQMVELTITGTADMKFDEGWPFDLDNGNLTHIVDADELEWVEIRSPELDAARPSVYGGKGAFGTDAVCIDWKCEAFGAHRTPPGAVQAFTVTTTSLLAQNEFELYERNHSHMPGSAI